MKENNTYLDEICLNMLRFLSIKKLFNIFNLLRLHCTIPQIGVLYSIL